MGNLNSQLTILLAVFLMLFGVAGCETSSLENEGSVSLAELEGESTAAEEAAEEESADGETSDSSDSETTATTSSSDDSATDSSGWPAEIDGSIKWLHTNVSSWPVTASLSASVSSSTINMPYSKSKVWPAVDGLNANPWAIVKINGQWYAGTFEYFRFGQTSKPVGVLDGSKGDHFKVSPLSSWRPSSGERFGIMVSGLARSNARNVKERSNVSMVTWP